MPDQNQTDPNQNSTTANTGSSLPPSFTPPSDLPPLPAEFTKVDSPAPAESNTPVVGAVPTTTDPVVPTTPIVEEVKEDSGSASPSDIRPMTAGPKKKFGGGKLIATILGVLLLVGGIGAGIVATQQPQLFQKQASGCSAGTYLCTCKAGSGCLSTGTSCVTYCGGFGNVVSDDSGTSCSPGEKTSCTTDRSCPGEKFCGSNGMYGTCLDLADNCPTVAGTCSPGQTQNCTTTQNCPGTRSCINGNWAAQCLDIANNCPATPPPTDNAQTYPAACTNGELPESNANYNGTITIPQSIISAGTCTLSHFWCPSLSSASGGCDSDNGQEIASGLHSVTLNKGCGVEQVDLYCPACGFGTNIASGARFYSKTWGTACNSEVSSPTPTPTATPGAPSCVGVKAYSSTWEPLSDTYLASVPVGTVINFCVTGSTVTGTFDKAQFKIGSTLEDETTARRPGSTDLCQEYTVLSTDTTVTVRAKIHGSTGVWVGESI